MRPDGAFQCSVAAAERGEPLLATASNVRRWLMVEVRGSWGPDVVADTALGRHVGPGWRAELASAGIRPLAIRRAPGAAPGAAPRAYLIDVARDARTAGVVRRRELPDLDAVAELPLLPHDVEGGEGWVPVDERLVLVCTNGKHDQCCANFGRPLVRHLRGGARSDSVWECTHIGGDRFAANLLVVPDGFYFGRVTPDVVDGLLDRLDDREVDLARFRGRSSLTFVEQAAEHFVRAELGLTAVDAVVRVRRRRASQPGGGHVASVDVELRDGRALVVAVERTSRRTIEPLTCTGSPGVSQPVHRLVAIDDAPAASDPS